MAAHVVNKKRVTWLLTTFVDRFQQKGGSLQLSIKRLLAKYDLDKSGELDRVELRNALEELLHGVTDDECVVYSKEAGSGASDAVMANGEMGLVVDVVRFDAVFVNFDADGSGAVSIEEFVAACVSIEKGAATDRGGTGTTGTFAVNMGSKRGVERDKASGLGHRSVEEFEGHGDDVRRGPEVSHGLRLEKAILSSQPSEHGRPLVEALKGRVTALATAKATDCVDNDARTLGNKLLRRALERHRATPAATSLTLDQFRAALDAVLSSAEELALLDRDCEALWHSLGGGHIETLMKRYSALPMPTVQASTRNAKRLRDLFLDKIVQTGSDSIRVAVKRLLTKFDTDRSGELSADEFHKLILELVPGTSRHDVKELLAEFDVDKNGSLSITEVSNSLVRAQRSRDATDFSLSLNKKKPLYTKAGARGT